MAPRPLLKRCARRTSSAASRPRNIMERPSDVRARILPLPFTCGRSAQCTTPPSPQAFVRRYPVKPLPPEVERSDGMGAMTIQQPPNKIKRHVCAHPQARSESRLVATVLAAFSTMRMPRIPGARRLQGVADRQRGCRQLCSSRSLSQGTKTWLGLPVRWPRCCWLALRLTDSPAFRQEQ